jgi:glycosyltransferase domain-containing protein
MKPLVSILIPTYNRPHYLEQALKSALNQTYRPIEIIICDNSEDDASKRMVKGYRHVPDGIKIRYVKNKENMGPISNQQQCLELATGEYVNYLMDDDLFHPDKIEKMMRYFLKYKGISLVTSQRRVIDASGNPIYVPPVGTFKRLYHKDKIIDGSKLTKRLLRDKTNYLGEPTTVLFRKKSLKEPFGVLLGKQAYFAVDLATWLNLLSKGKGVYMVQPLSYLRYHTQQLSQHKYAKAIAKLDKATFMNFAKKQGYLKLKKEK